MGKWSSLFHFLVTMFVALLAVLLGFPPLIILPFVLLLQALVVLDHLWLFVFIPEGTHRGRDCGFAGHAIEAVTVGALMGMHRITSFPFFTISTLSRLLLPFVARITIIWITSLSPSIFPLVTSIIVIILLSNRYWPWNSSAGARIDNGFGIDSRVWVGLTSFATEADCGSGFRVSCQREEGLYILFDLIDWLRRSHHDISALAERIPLHFSIATTSVNCLSGRVMCVLVFVDLLSGYHGLLRLKVHYFFDVQGVLIISLHVCSHRIRVQIQSVIRWCSLSTHQ